MIKNKKILLGFILITFLHSCGAGSDAAKVLKNEKIRNTDEFLVKKRDPLSLPPDFREMPSPNSIAIKEKKKAEIDKLNNILKDVKKNQHV